MRLTSPALPQCWSVSRPLLARVGPKRAASEMVLEARILRLQAFHIHGLTNVQLPYALQSSCLRHTDGKFVRSFIDGFVARFWWKLEVDWGGTMQDP